MNEEIKRPEVTEPRWAALGLQNGLDESFRYSSPGQDGHRGLRR
jgi:hypothetical protein